MATTAAATGTVVLVDAALAPYEHPDLRWMVRKHVLPVLQDFPTLSPSVDTYTSDSGASTVLLNARGLLTVSSALPPVLLTLWLPREYPYLPLLAYVFPAAPSSASLSLDGERWRTKYASSMKDTAIHAMKKPRKVTSSGVGFTKCVNFRRKD